MRTPPPRQVRELQVAYKIITHLAPDLVTTALSGGRGQGQTRLVAGGRCSEGGRATNSKIWTLTSRTQRKIGMQSYERAQKKRKCERASRKEGKVVGEETNNCWKSTPRTVSSQKEPVYLHQFSVNPKRKVKFGLPET